MILISIRTTVSSNKENYTILSEQFQNPIEKSQKQMQN